VTTSASARSGSLRLVALPRPGALRGVLTSWTVLDVLLPFGVTRLVLVLVGLFAQYTMAGAPDSDHWRASSHAIVNAWAGWDSRWYIEIVQGGYTTQPNADGQLPIAFWPGLPLLMKLGSLLVGRADTEALAVVGIVVANLALLLALLGLVGLARLDFGADVGGRVGLYLLVFPASVFLSAVYPQSLLLAAAAGSFLAARRGAWWMAGILGAVAALARAYGVVLLVPLGYELWRQTRGARPGARVAAAAPLALVPLAVLAWAGFVGWQYGSPQALVEAQRAWGRAPTAPWQIFEPYVSGYNSVYGYRGTFLDLGFLVLYALGTVATWRLLPRSYALLATALFLVPLATGSTQSMMRLLLENFPLFLVLALAGRARPFDAAYLVLGMGFATVFAVMFALHYWVA
jgi:hypothetical protein